MESDGMVPPMKGTSAASCPPGSSPFSGVQLQDSAADAPGSPSKRSAALDLTDAVISLQTDPKRRDAPSIVLPHQNAEFISHIAIDIGGSLIKLVYFSPEDTQAEGWENGKTRNQAGGKIHFVKFETQRIDDCIDFIEAKGLHRTHNGKGEPDGRVRIVATGGGAFKYADKFEERLGVLLEKEDEMDCLVSGSNFLLKAIRHEAFMYENSQTIFAPSNTDQDLYPYLLVNIGSGVSMLKVDGDGQYERVSGSSLGGGTFWGLCRLLTKCRSFDEMLELSSRGDNSKVDMLVGDIYGDRDYSAIGLSASTIASSFGKVVAENKDLEDYDPADIAVALTRMVSYNISHLAYLNAKAYGIQRVFFGGFYIRGHPYTMETISYAIRFWSKGSMSAKFLRHEGFLGAVGAFLKVHPMTPPNQASTGSREPRKVRANFVERFSMGAPYSGGEIHGPAFSDVAEKVDWVERFVRLGTQATEAARSERDRAQAGMGLSRDSSGSDFLAPESPSPSSSPMPRMNLHLGVLHYTPSREPFPLLADAVHYTPDTLDIWGDRAEMDYWLGVLLDQVGTVVEKAAACDGQPDGRRRAAAFGRALEAHLVKMRSEPGAYGQLGLSDLLEMREDCLREFRFTDVYRLDKARENAAALEVLPDLLTELDGMAPAPRLTALIEGCLAANIFDWGAKACVDLYHNGTILEIYREARTKLSRRPWRVDTFDALAANWFGASSSDTLGESSAVPRSPFRRVIMFVDNAGADIVLGMIPFARELLRMGAEVVMCANSQPAINDITAPELRALLNQVAAVCPVIKARLYVCGNGQGSPCLDLRRVPEALADATVGTDLVVVEGMGRAIHTNYRSKFKCASLKLAMIKNQHLAERLFGGNVYDCVCLYEPPANT
ncbi:fumble-domain-containing protein [Coccomyxa subellipsoidea C-169]|uniref:pantothenate kinase n=1 Tax=Coccomyxa subellipsoidea (strain C-169) TaxID=574566 RepID=I0Z2W3_COCSC|nr:fumble-domain-containing protein [Coccomyxa subellipsoidea C-169]EIE24982.1 fumble-domain-containing protein [Coccomyxa subellipsoidea C-169]|eukprot:XP_005649526.1 fumble-domain-containing protein [Coccomyxa subellipsoidea C-169]